VPLTNYLGWYLTVFVFLFLFSLYRARRQTTDATRLSSTYWAQPAVLFLIMALVYETDYLAGSDVTLTDATGATWRSADIHETAAIVSLFTMVFVAVTCLLILARRARG
jgi:putative membrane protein